MTDTNIDSSDSPSVTATVEKMLRRRQQLLRLFTGLLFIPLLAAIAFAAFGRSQEKMQQQVESQVATVQERLQNLPDPKKQQALEKEVKEIETTMEQQRTKLNEQVNQIKAINTSQKEMNEWQKRIDGTSSPVQERFEYERGGLKGVRDPLEDFTNRLQDQEKRIQDQEKTIQDLQQKLEKLQKECCNRLPSPGTM